MTSQELGDCRPSQLLPGSQNSANQDTILREFFLSKLPERIRIDLAAAEDMSLDQLAVLADRTADYSAPAVHAVITHAPDSWETAAERMATEIDPLAAAIDALTPSQDRSAILRQRSSSHAC